MRPMGKKGPSYQKWKSFYIVEESKDLATHVSILLVEYDFPKEVEESKECDE